MEKFDYTGALEEIDLIIRKVEDPKTSLDEIAPLMKRAGELTSSCREYLRSVREDINGNE